AGLGMVVPVNDEGRFTDDVPEWAGENVFDANPDIIRALKDAGRLVRHDSYEHNYPHCWRTDTPIIYRAMPSWYVKVTDIRDRLVELNQQINWIPENVRDGRFGRWLEGARDWSISRNRFWGSPIPIWLSDNPEFPRIDVYGSLDELEADFGVRPDNLHRPFIDELTRPNPDDPSGQSTMRRVPEVLDCWFESGSMPFAQVHYPFENKDWFEQHFPADFIVEYINQVRGWFYTLHVLAGALFDKPAFQNVICHGILLADDGAKLSKKLRNYTEPTEIFEQQGSDALRWYFMSSNIVRGGDARISDHAINEVTRQVLLPIWNAYSFFTLYANIDGYRAEERADSANEIDRYILAKLRTTVEAITESMDAYDLAGATEHIGGFLDALNNWYIRRSRDRFWGPEDVTSPEGADKKAAYDTLYTVLTTFLRTAAPFLPLVTEEIYGNLTGGQSVHLADWPEPAELVDDPFLVSEMDLVRDIATAALRLREDHGLRVRLPLSSITLVNVALDDGFVPIVLDEVNVKTAADSTDLDAYATVVLQPDGKALGPKLGGAVQSVFKAAKAGDYTMNDDGTVIVGEHTLEPGEFDLRFEPAEGVVAAALPGGRGVVVLDTEVTPELNAEGWARDLVRHVQQARKDADLVVTDRIDLAIEASGELAAAIETHQGYIAEQVLATSFTVGDGSGAHTASVELDGQPATISFSVA
ncbi:MAG: isoleucine--tRNA ligase, partial [Acidimicrobiales bacterium]|nr:isoleucine--tRNA ligase [Acidimicrobiales bacterium]